MTTPRFDRAEVLRSLRLFMEAGDVTELRALDAQLSGERGKGTVSGYFDSPEKLADAVGRITSAKGVYLLANPAKPELLARAANRVRFAGKGDPLTSDADVTRRRWLLIDLDPQRPAGIGSTDAEHQLARDRAESIRDDLRAEGWPEPVLADSGNGWHLLYRIDAPANDAGMVQRTLTELAARFGDERVLVDTSVHNPARIWKLYGTLACKGDSTPSRPHRMARIVDMPEALDVVPTSLLAALGGPDKPKPARGVSRLGHGAFDLEAWIRQHLPDADGPRDWKNGGSMWVLPVCPFNADHVGGSAFIGRQPGGAIVAGCHHNSCQHWGWKELRARLGPTASQSVADHGGCTDAGNPVTDEDGGEGPKASQAEHLVRLAQELCRLGQTPKREPFAVLNGGPNVAMRLSSSGGPLRDTLAKEYRRRFGRVASSTAYADAIAAIRGEAMEADPEPTHLRVAPHAGGIVLDLGTSDGAAVVVDATGWRVVNRSPVLFTRTALSGALPKPTRGGHLEDLRRLLNVTDDTWPVLLGWLVAALLPDMPHPILMLGGQQGSGKTTAARFLCGLFDPSDAPTRSQPRDPEAWALGVANGWSAVIDNVSAIPGWWSDALCKAVTGDGWVRRTLYTDGDVSILSYRRVIVLTSIDAGALRGDLGERLVLVDLLPIGPDARLTERALNATYAMLRPALLGALLDVASAVLARLDTVVVPTLPRMADFARVLAAMDAAIGTSALTIYGGQGERIAGEVVESDPVGRAVVQFMATHREWSGTVSNLLALIQSADAGRDWPKSGRGLAARLKRLAPALESQGVRVTPPGPTDKRRVWMLQAIAQTAQSPKVGPAAVPRGVEAGGLVPSIARPPDDRPCLEPPHESTWADSGRLGGLGGSMHATAEVMAHADTWADGSPIMIPGGEDTDGEMIL